jgi:hypothetical protein
MKFTSSGLLMRKVGSDRWKVTRGSLKSTGYRYVHINYKHFRIHRLICEAFNGPPPTPSHVVNHKNGIKDDNRPNNLEWMTIGENTHHARSELKVAMGRKSIDKVRMMELLNEGLHQWQVGRLMGVSQAAISWHFKQIRKTKNV